MARPLRLILFPIPLAALIVLVSGCQSNDERLADLAKQHASQQAEQARQFAKMHEEVITASHQLVEADSRARSELTSMQRELRADQAQVGKQRDSLEAERRQIAEQRQWDSVVGDAMIAVGTLLACLLPLLAIIYLLRAARHEEQTDQALIEVLVREATSEHPMFMPPSRAFPALGQTPTPDRGFHEDDGQRS